MLALNVSKIRASLQGLVASIGQGLTRFIAAFVRLKRMFDKKKNLIYKESVCLNVKFHLCMKMIFILTFTTLQVCKSGIMGFSNKLICILIVSVGFSFLQPIEKKSIFTQENLHPSYLLCNGVISSVM